MNLPSLIQDIEVTAMHGDARRAVTDITFDSRNVMKGALFVAITGTGADGHAFIGNALEAGATSVLCEKLPGELKENITYIETKNTRKALALMASAWYGHPSRDLQLVGVTGTNGKTTIATLLYKVNTGLGYKAGILTTIEILIQGESYPATHTTPDPLQVNKWLREMVDKGCQYCFMEVSSIAVDQYRVAGLQFSGGIFTNLTHDHLDYHGSYRNYLEAKKAFFDTLHKKAFALTNIDDRNGEVMIQNTVAQKYRYGLTRLSDFHGKILESRFEGMGLLIEDKEVWVRLSGKFNAYNILAVYAACILLGHDQDQVLEQISNAGTVAGRFDIVRGSGGTLAVIDYAHTDDALKNVLESIIEVNAENLDITTVVGAGGERDRDKRPKMGSVAARLSTRVILTSDNPRSEDPAAIIKEMQQGIDPSHMDQVLKITDREEAIKTACMLAPVGSIILLAGKGHEKYQEIKGERFHFDDKEVVTKYLK